MSLKRLLADDVEPLDLLACRTPPAWVQAAVANLPVLLIDHANCEKKAASTALSLLFRYPDNVALTHWMSRLAREELRHFEQVSKLMQRRGIRWRTVPASRYAEGLRAQVRRQEPGRLLDMLIVGALIEARSCERFEAIEPHLDAELAAFCRGLSASERRHFQRYIHLAATEAERAGIGEQEMSVRLSTLVAAERSLVESPDDAFAFHSGVPVTGAA
jgi:tRNA-(ms[2]io[6]A)-hydroxylase